MRCSFSKPLDMPVIIGLLMLVGIVTKNAIMLVDFAMVAMRRGLAGSRRSWMPGTNGPGRSS